MKNYNKRKFDSEFLSGKKNTEGDGFPENNGRHIKQKKGGNTGATGNRTQATGIKIRGPTARL